MGWANRVLGEAACVNLLIDGWMRVDGWDGDMPRMIPTEHGFGLMNLKSPLPEESKCGIS